MAILKNTIISDTGFLKFPTGNIAQRPASPTSGMMRINSEPWVRPEFYNGTRWIDCNLPYSIVTSGLVWGIDTQLNASYPGTGTTIYDFSPSGLHATGPSAITGGAIQDTQMFTTASTSILDTDNHTILLLIQISGTNGAYSKIFEYAPAGTDRSPGVWRYPSNTFIHWRYDPGNSSSDFTVSNIGTTGAEFSPNRWYYMGVAKSGTTARVFMNGIPLGNQTVSSPKTAGSAQIKLYPGYSQSTSKMAAVHIYNRALTDAEVFQNFTTMRLRYDI